MAHNEDFLRLAADAKKHIKEISPDKARELQAAGVQLIDVREKDEFESGHIEGATHVGRGVLEMKIGDVVPDKNTPLVCYCAGGNRGALAAETLQKLGYTQVFSIAGGLRAFQESVVKDDVSS